MESCKHCRQPLSGYYEVVRVRPDGSEHGRVRVCSLICLVQFSYAQAVAQGVQVVVGAKGMLDRLKGLFR